MAASRKFVLLVDKDQALTDSLIALFRLAGYCPIACRDSDDAFRVISVIVPDVIVTEACMDCGAGLEIAITAKRLCPECKILLLSENPRKSELMERIAALGHSFDVLAKPVHPVDLLARMRTKTTKTRCRNPRR